MPRPDGEKRCYACLKGSTTRCFRKCFGATDFCKGHAKWGSRLRAGDQEYNRFIDSDEEGGGDEELPDSGRKKKKTKKKKKKKQVTSDHDERGGEEEVDTYLAKPLPAPKTSSPRFDGVVPLGALDSLIDYEPVGTKGEIPSPGVVASPDEVDEASAAFTWAALPPHLVPNLQAFLPQELKDVLPPNHAEYFPKILHAVVSRKVQVYCFGGDSGSSVSMSLLLGKLSHTRKITPMLQLEEILEIFRHVSPDHNDLSGSAAQDLWFRDPSTSKVDLERILSSFSERFAADLAFALVQPCVDARDAGTSIFESNLSYPRCLMFLGPSGHGSVAHLQELFQLSPFGELKVDSATQALLNAGEWTTTEVYAEMLEGHLFHLDNTIKGMNESGEGWASQPVIPKIKNATLGELAFFIKTITSALSARESLLPRKRGRVDEDEEPRGGTCSLKANKVTPLSLIPSTKEMLTRCRKPREITVDLEIAPLPGATSTSGDSTGEGTNTAGDRARPMTAAERARLQREFADEYSNSEATSALDPTKLKALVLGRGDDTRYDKRMHAPVPGGKAHYRTLVRSRGRQLGIALSDEQIDFLIQRQLSRVNFNLYEHYTSSLKLEQKQKKHQQQLPAIFRVTLLLVNV